MPDGWSEAMPDSALAARRYAVALAGGTLTSLPPGSYAASRRAANRTPYLRNHCPVSSELSGTIA